MQQQHSTKFLRQRKFLLVLPVLVIPFITLAFWALGGGKGSDAKAAQGDTQTGLNLELPNANFKKDEVMDKLGYYEKAASDSAKLIELMKNDPYFSRQMDYEDTLSHASAVTNNGGTSSPNPKHYGAGNPSGNTSQYQDPNEAKVYQKLAELNTAINDAPARNQSTKENYFPVNDQPTLQSADADRMEQMMQAMNKEGGDEDGEMKQLNGMLEKILDIQHPERIKEKLKEKSIQHKGEIFAVSSNISKASVSLLDTIKKKSKQSDGIGFYSAVDPVDENEIQFGIEAVVHERQTLVNGAVIKIRLLTGVYINGQLIPKDNFVFGTASLNNERLEVNINSVRYQHSLYPVKLEVYDIDGLPGIYIPGAINRDVAKQSTDNALQSVALNSLDPSIGAQAASAGIEAAKTLLSKKVKMIKVEVKAGYKILLKDNNQQQ